MVEKLLNQENERFSQTINPLNFYASIYYI